MFIDITRRYGPELAAPFWFIKNGYLPPPDVDRNDRTAILRNEKVECSLRLGDLRHFVGRCETHEPRALANEVIIFNNGK